MENNTAQATVEKTAKERPVRTVVVDRSQIQWTVLDLESLIDEVHPARAIWELSGKFDLKRFEGDVKSREGGAGRPCWSARLLVSVWIYSYTLGVASARAIERMVKHEPGFRWLTGDQEINHHTLSSFRVGHGEALNELFAQFLAMLDTAELVDLKTLLQDGTKVRTVAGKCSFHRRKTLEKRLQQARQVVAKWNEPGEGEAMDERRRAARARAARQGLERAEKALEKLIQREAEAGGKEKEKVRVSDSEPEAVKMKQPDGGWAPSYNVQVTTEVQSRMIVAVGVTTAANDTQELMPAVERVKENCGIVPEQVIADNGYASRSNVEQTTEQNIELIAPWKEDASREAGACARNGIRPEFAPSAFRPDEEGKELTCPAGKILVVIGQKTQHGLPMNIFEAQESDCQSCPMRAECCGDRSGPRQIRRPVETPAMQQYLDRMKQPEVKELYRKRSEIAEFPHLWAKAVKGWRRFSVRGLAKAGMEAVWVALAYNVSQWLRLRPSEAVAA